ARDGKGACVSLGVSFRRVDECHIGELPGIESESGRLLEVKSHRAFRNFFSTHQLGRLTCHLTRDRDRFGSHGYLLNRVYIWCAVTTTGRQLLQPGSPWKIHEIRL